MSTIITAQVADAVVNGRRVADYVDLRHNPRHNHSLDDIVGYVVRETVRNRKPIVVAPSTGRGALIGQDVAVVEGGNRYAEAFPVRDAYRNTPGGYAVVDSLYACGCRSW